MSKADSIVYKHIKNVYSAFYYDLVTIIKAKKVGCFANAHIG